MLLPAMYRIRQRLGGPHLSDVEAATTEQLNCCGVKLRPGQRVAIAVGSRGIAHLPALVRSIVQWVRAQGAEPFLVPAMGSHGGATADGQRHILESYGLTPQTVGAEIHASMEVIELPAGGLPVPIFFDRLAAGADATIVLNRVKPHTSFHGDYESGLMKMLAVGLGKHAAAEAIHRLGVAGLREIMPAVARQVLAAANVALGVAVVEDACDQTLCVRAIPADRIPLEEPPLLELARQNMPCLPVEQLDLLIVERMGKDVSGLGMDPNVIGRLKIRGQPEPATPDIRVIVALDLTEASQGNAIGVGLADIITRRLFEKIDFRVTYENVLTSTFIERGKIPLVAADEAEAMAFACRALGATSPETLRAVRILDTLHLGELQVSPAVWAELRHRPGIELLAAP